MLLKDIQLLENYSEFESIGAKKIIVRGSVSETATPEQLFSIEYEHSEHNFDLIYNSKGNLTKVVHYTVTKNLAEYYYKVYYNELGQICMVCKIYNKDGKELHFSSSIEYNNDGFVSRRKQICKGLLSNYSTTIADYNYSGNSIFIEVTESGLPRELYVKSIIKNEFNRPIEINRYNSSKIIQGRAAIKYMSNNGPVISHKGFDNKGNLNYAKEYSFNDNGDIDVFKYKDSHSKYIWEYKFKYFNSINWTEKKCYYNGTLMIKYHRTIFT